MAKLHLINKGHNIVYKLDRIIANAELIIIKYNFTNRKVLETADVYRQQIVQCTQIDYVVVMMGNGAMN